MSKFELVAIPVKSNSYEKPERKNQNIDSKKYDKIDKECSENVFLSNDGNVYIPVKSVPTIINQQKKRANYIIDNIISDADKRNIAGQEVINSAGINYYLDKNSHQTRDAEDAELNRYARNHLIGIGDSDQAEAIRRQLDTHTNKELPKLKKQRGSDVDEITGEPLEKKAAFHHSNEKEIFNYPNDVLDPEKGINVNDETHKEIHRLNIMDSETLEKNKEKIKKNITKK
ncbi:hypothetical protein [Clostridium aquiflavi]|uniref:Uncharacterized protein n=1 Tax=Clostridium aquiflavi TaxID=3073603 RepID=A0ABU1ECE2_9CLOT|nr:hypothetical protein [Clostridium sp. 5N-1]MDR5586056.1 hypothetical protein [Clostridium sp. 5N-1]